MCNPGEISSMKCEVIDGLNKKGIGVEEMAVQEKRSLSLDGSGLNQPGLEIMN